MERTLGGTMPTTVQRWCLWCGPAMIVLWLAGFALLADFLTPPSPGDDAQETAELYRENQNSIRLGLLMTTIGSALLGPFLMLIAALMKRIEGRFSPLTYLQIGFGAIFVIEFIMPVMFMQVAAYRKERSPELIQLLNDAGWLWFVGIASTIVVELVAVGATILRDTRADPILPRWSGYLSLWTGLLIISSNLIVFFHDGPFAWNGVLAWYVPIAAFSIWVGAMMFLLGRDIRRQENDPLALDDRAASSTVTHAEFAIAMAHLDEMRQRLSEIEARPS